MQARSNPSECGGCRQRRTLVGVRGAPVGTRHLKPTMCGSCAGNPRFLYLCVRCGGSEETYKAGVCVRCAVRDQLISAFGDALPGSPVAELTTALAASRRPRSVMQWLRNPRGGARVLRQLLQAGDVISHATLDRFDEREVWSLRRTLTDLGVLPERHDAIARLDAVLERVVADLPAPNRRLLQAYGGWWCLRRARRQYERTGSFTYSQFRNTWHRLTEASNFLSWLTSRGIDLADLDQPTLDVWMDTARPDQRSAASDFLTWAARRHLAPILTVAFTAHAEPEILLSEEARWALFAQCMHDRSMPDDVRAAGALLLLFGLPLVRITELTRAHLVAGSRDAATAFSVALGSPTIEVPPSLGQILWRLPADIPSRGRPLIPSPSATVDWLFPGRGTTGHVSTTALSARLRRNGISVREARNAALISLAADLPAPVLSDMLGMSVAAAIKWSRRAGRDWDGYVAAVASRDRAQADGQVRRPLG